MKQNWWKLLCIQAGGAICLPVIMVGQMLALQYGFGAALAMILIGNGLLLLYSLFSSRLGVTSGKSTVEIAAERFGRHGPHLFGAIFLCSMVGWFAIQINVVAESISLLLPIPVFLLNCLLGALMTLVSASGIRGLNILSQLSLPLLIGTLCVALCSITGTPTPVPHDFSILGISLVIATAIGGAIDLPTYWRHAKSSRDGAVAAILLFGLVLPLIELVGVYLGIHASGGTLLATLSQGGGPLWTCWVALFLFIAGWTTNNTNLYSAGTNSFALLPGLSFTQRTFCIGAVGTILACLGVLSHFTIALEVMGIMIGSMGAVLVFKTDSPYLPFFIGLILGICTLSGFLPGAPVVNAFLISALATFMRRPNAIFAKR